MPTIRLASLIAALVPLLARFVTPAWASDPPFHELWRQGGDRAFEGWNLVGVRVDGGRLVLDPPDAPVPEAGAGAAPAAIRSATAGPIARSGTALGPEHETAEPFGELIPSWNAETPDGTWIEVRLRARIGGRWTGWYVLGVWSSGGGELRRSVDGQDDADARVPTDTLALQAPAEAYQLELGLFSNDPRRGPSVSLAAVLASRRSAVARPDPGEPRALGVALAVPERSQMVYAGGGEAWCSPTSTSMVLAYWAGRLGAPGLDHPPPEVAAGTYDLTYHGHGNWPFSTAYAAQGDLLGYVSRFSSLGQVERWVAAGVPVVVSVAWGPGDLPGAPVGSTDGHLLVVVGFTEAGDVVVNDPASDPRLGQAVRRVYSRGRFESLWLTSSGGTVYLIHPAGQAPAAEGAFGAW